MIALANIVILGCFIESIPSVTIAFSTKSFIYPPNSSSILSIPPHHLPSPPTFILLPPPPPPSIYLTYSFAQTRLSFHINYSIVSNYTTLFPISSPSHISLYFSIIYTSASFKSCPNNASTLLVFLRVDYCYEQLISKPSSPPPNFLHSILWQSYSNITFQLWIFIYLNIHLTMSRFTRYLRESNLNEFYDEARKLRDALLKHGIIKDRTYHLKVSSAPVLPSICCANEWIYFLIVQKKKKHLKKKTPQSNAHPLF